MIGVGITTRNRRQLAAMTIKQWKELMPPNSKLVIVDDASDVPFPNANYRFEKQAGIARAKNKCLELLQDCEHIFLSDDDCFPAKQNWFEPYINNSQPHLSYTFTELKDGRKNGRILMGFGKDYQYFQLPCGCLLYLTKKVLQTIGGFDTDFLIWGYEHVEYSRRAYNAGLTEQRYCDVMNSNNIWFSYDRNQAVVTSTPERGLYIDSNKLKFDSKENDKHFKPYL
jgi:glycosyltransferase involved in cell wall biosynthesis